MANILQFWITFFATYDITTEVVIMIMIAALMIIIRMSKPERTYMMKICYYGTHVALFTMISHICMLGATISLRTGGSLFAVYVWYFIFAFFDATVLNFIFLYFSQLSYKKRGDKMGLYYACIAMFFIYMAIMAIPVMRGNLLDERDGILVLSFSSNAYVLCSLLCLTFCSISFIINCKEVTRVVRIGCYVFIPIEMIGVLSQLYFPTAYFICATFTLPFFIFYMLFHVNKFSEIMGYQNFEVANNHLDRLIVGKRKFTLIIVRFTKLENREYQEIRNNFEMVGNEWSRKVEGIKFNLRIYNIKPMQFMIIAPVKDDSERDLVNKKILDIVTNPIKIGDIDYSTPTQVLVSENFELIERSDEYFAFINEMQRKFMNPEVNELMYVTEEDCKKFKKTALIENNLLNMRDSGVLDDDRVLVYIQPIFDVASGKFKSGESLMRMKIDGKMVFPDEFIPVAENIGCIHTLTRIMLYKVSKKVMELSKTHNFDAVTVNISTVEMTDPKVHDEFSDIIISSGADPRMIRLEITESTTIADYDTIGANMRAMNLRGINFYLDDFGTGYSNIERITNFPFQTIKFDKSLLYRALEDKKSEKLFLLLADFFKQNGFKTVIEGVEDEAQREYVVKAGFDYIQGYFYSKPVPADDIDSFFEAK